MNQNIFFGEGDACVVYERININITYGQFAVGSPGGQNSTWWKKKSLEARVLLVFLEYRKQFMRILRWTAGRDHVLILSTGTITVEFCLSR